MGIYVFSRQVLIDVLDQPGIDFGKEIIPAALSRLQGQRVPAQRLLGRRRDHRRPTTTPTCCSRVRMRRSSSTIPERPIFSHPRNLPGSRLDDCTVRRRHSSAMAARSIARSTISDSVVGVRTVVRAGQPDLALAARSAPTTTSRMTLRPRRGSVPPTRHRRQRGARSRDRRQERARRRQRAPRQRTQRAGCRRRRLLHPERHHHRAEGTASWRTGRSCDSEGLEGLVLRAMRTMIATGSWIIVVASKAGVAPPATSK